MKTLILSCIFVSNPSYGRDLVVAIIDTGLDLNDHRFTAKMCRTGHRDFSGEGFEDYHGHGTHVFGTIQKYAPEAGWCAVIIKFYAHKKRDQSAANKKAFLYLLELKPDFVNYSGGGYGQEYFEEQVIKILPKTTFIAAIGNNSEDLSKSGNSYYPAQLPYKNVIPVGGVDTKGQRLPSSNFGLPYVRNELGVVYSTLPNGENGYMTGSSQATAVATGKILKETIDKKRRNW